jgi:uncharacterized protein YukE
MQFTDEDKIWLSTLLTTLIGQSEARTAQAIQDSETRLLTAFHEWASPMGQRMRTHREALRALDLQIEEIASRVKRLEDAAETRH